MDLMSIMSLAEKQGFSLKGEDKEKGYVITIRNPKKQVVFTCTSSGGGIFWEFKDDAFYEACKKKRAR
jgi:hypothetical protein